MCFRLYPTFKEWKLFPIPLERVKKCLSLYPTFKEWKHLRGFETELQICFVYILPLRNENH